MNKQDKKYVSRGGLKLEEALNKFQVNPTGKVCLDFGSSTGGFVDCLLQHGGSKVYSVDTAYGQLDWNLRNDSRVVVMERTNILYLESLPEKVDLITIDAGWTRLELVLPVCRRFLSEGGEIIALLKPHYEAPTLVRKGVLPPENLEAVITKTLTQIDKLGFLITARTPSPIEGGKGNVEYLLHLKLKGVL